MAALDIRCDARAAHASCHACSERRHTQRLCAGRSPALLQRAATGFLTGSSSFLCVVCWRANTEAASCQHSPLLRVGMLVMSKALPAASVLVASKPGRAPRRPGRLRVRAQGDAQQDPTSPLILPSRRELEIIGRGAPTGKLGGSDDIFRLPPGLRGLSPDDLPTQGRSVVEGNRGTAVQEREPGFTDVDYLSVRATATAT